MVMEGWMDNGSLLSQPLSGGTVAGSLGNGLQRTATKTITWDGTSGLGANATTTTFFTVAGGEVEVVSIAGRVTTNHTVSNALATLALGAVGNAAVFIAATVVLNVTGLLAATPIWMTTTPTAGALAIPAACKNTVVTGNILTTVGGTGNVSGGVIEINVIWRPITPGATLTAA